MELSVTHNNITFVDAQAMRMKYLATFEAPDKESLEKIKTGNYVKICVNNERFWVEVTGVKGDIVTGRIDNKLLQQGLKYNDVIEFPKNCIFSIHELTDI